MAPSRVRLIVADAATMEAAVEGDDALARAPGWGGFKGPPVDGEVEFGYAIAPARQGEGLATAAVGEMLREAYAAPEVRAVRAHTLPERNASVRVLEKVGFVLAGDGVESGRTVWRFRHRGPQPSRAP